MTLTKLMAALPAVPLCLFASAAVGHAQSSWVGPWAASQHTYPIRTEATPSPVVTGPRIAVTFDDLPAHSALPPGETRMDVVTKILAALQGAHLPPTYGFVNGLRIGEEPTSAGVLQAWRAAGYPLGNHSWSHMNLGQHSIAEFEADISRDEPLLSAWMREDGDWHWFRFPFLVEGDTPEKRASVRAFLGQRGYKIAAVTMSFGDYLWNEPYARCKAKHDAPAIATLESSYLAAADAGISYYRGLSQTLYGREIPYVLLMHIGAFDAEMLPRLLNLYRSRGFQFVTLNEAESDEFYRQDTDLSLRPAADSLEEVMAERHLRLPARAAPGVQLEEVCR